MADPAPPQCNSYISQAGPSPRGPFYFCVSRQFQSDDSKDSAA